MKFATLALVLVTTVLLSACSPRTPNTITGSVTIDTDFVPTEIRSFKETGDEACVRNGKPVFFVFGTTWCPHCNWVKDAFKEVVAEYKDQIDAHFWEIDTGDDYLTEEVEKGVPPGDLALFNKYNPRGSVPTYVMTCKYTRVGNAYEPQSLKAEKEEFRLVINKIRQEVLV